jgi:PHP family Zn ribbon phosphoesterase
MAKDFSVYHKLATTFHKKADVHLISCSSPTSFKTKDEALEYAKGKGLALVGSYDLIAKKTRVFMHVVCRPENLEVEKSNFDPVQKVQQFFSH